MFLFPKHLPTLAAWETLKAPLTGSHHLGGMTHRATGADKEELGQGRKVVRKHLVWGPLRAGNRDDVCLEGCTRTGPREEWGPGLRGEGGATEGPGDWPPLSSGVARGTPLFRLKLPSRKLGR